MRAPDRSILVIALILSFGSITSCAPRKTSTFEPDSIPEAYLHSTAALSWPGATRAFQITPVGDLTNGDWMVRLRLEAGNEPAALPRVIAFEDRWLPVARWTRRGTTVRWDMEAVALPEQEIGAAAYRGSPIPAARDSGLLMSLEVMATSLASTPVTATLELALGDLDSSAAWVAYDAPATFGGARWGSGGQTSEAVHGWTSLDAGSNTTGASTTGVSWTLAPGTSRTARFVIPAYPTPERALETWARVPHVRRADQSRRHWNGELSRSARFQLGDPEVENAMRAALVLLLACRERRGSTWLPIGSPLHYRDVWLRDGARALNALAIMGRVEEARALAAGLAAYQWPEGAFMSQRAQLDGTGQALWAFGQTLLRPSPAESLGPFADRALLAWRWCERQREMGRTVGLPFGAMLPFADPHDNELVRAQLVGNDAWAIAGYRSAARLLRAAGRTAEADSIDRSRVQYVRDFEDALARSGAADVPPSWQSIGRDFGNVAVAYPCGALPAESARCAALAARLWSGAGGAGLCTYAHPDSLHYYLGADLGTWALLAGRRAAADSVLDAMLAWRSASGGAAEIFSRVTRDYGLNPPPHTTSASALLALVRNSIVYDEDDTLWLTLGARPAWWKNGRVTGTPTRWGTLDVRFARRGAEAEWSWSPVSVWTALTLPPGTIVDGAPVAPLRAGSRAEVVLAPPGTRSARVALSEVRGSVGSTP